jgi:hypothetical protein
MALTLDDRIRTYYGDTRTALRAGTNTAAVLAEYADHMRAKAAMPGCAERLAEELSLSADAISRGIDDHHNQENKGGGPMTDTTHSDPYDHLAIMAASTFHYTGRERTRTEIRYQDAADWSWEEDASPTLDRVGVPIVERRQVWQKEITQICRDGQQITTWERQEPTSHTHPLDADEEASFGGGHPADYGDN